MNLRFHYDDSYERDSRHRWGSRSINCCRNISDGDGNSDMETRLWHENMKKEGKNGISDVNGSIERKKVMDMMEKWKKRREWKKKQ